MSRIRPSTLAIFLPLALLMLLFALREPLYQIGSAAARQHAELSSQCRPSG